jgi:hypothetical protein
MVGDGTMLPFPCTAYFDYQCSPEEESVCPVSCEVCDCADNLNHVESLGRSCATTTDCTDSINSNNCAVTCNTCGSFLRPPREYVSAALQLGGLRFDDDVNWFLFGYGGWDLINNIIQIKMFVF